MVVCGFPTGHHGCISLAASAFTEEGKTAPERLSAQLRRELRQTGLTARAIDAAWPEWWSSDAESSVSAAAELRFTLARRLGLSPASLFEGPPKFVWRDEAKFKRLSTAADIERAAISSFGIALGRMLMNATPEPQAELPPSGETIRTAILQSSPYVNLTDVLAACWAFGIAVVHAEVLPLRYKRMTAMSVSMQGRHSIILGRVSKFEAQLAYTIAHELGHIALGHITSTSAVVEMGDPLTNSQRLDQEEIAADEFALELLTGSKHPVVIATEDNFTATQLANAALRASPVGRINPGVLALCLGHSTGQWDKAFGALKVLFPNDSILSHSINDLALQQLSLDTIPSESATYIRRVMSNT